METKKTIERKDDGTIILTITVPSSDVKKAREAVENELIKHVSLPGFRKGKVPKAQAVAKLPADLVQEETLKKVLPKAYNKAIEENNLHPVISPKLHLLPQEEGKDLEFTAETCELPKLELKNYKDEVKKVTASSKIVVPHSPHSPAKAGSVQASSGQAGKEQPKPSMDEILAAVVKSTEAQIPKIMADQEVNRLLSNLLDELKKLGLTLDQYLSSRGKTAEQLRAEYEEKAKNDLKLEFALKKIADNERIIVEQKDIDETLNTIKDPKQKEEISKNPYFLAGIIRQQKTLDFLSKI